MTLGRFTAHRSSTERLPWRPLLVAVGLSYLGGSLPIVYLLGRAAGVDLRAYGSGNVGSHNLSGAAGPVIGLAGWLSDAAKGAAAVTLTRRVTGDEASAGWALVGAMAGQCWPPLLGGRGGRGVATLVGGMLTLTPRAAPWSLGAIAAIAGLRPLARRLSALQAIRADVTPIGVLVGALLWPLVCAREQRSRDHRWAAAAAATLLIIRRMSAGALPGERVPATLLARTLLDRDRRVNPAHVGHVPENRFKLARWRLTSC